MAAITDLWIKVPNPFWGVDTVGFSLRYPLDPSPAELSDLPLFVEGEAPLMTSLAQQLRLFPQRELFVDCQAPGEAYSWTDPIRLSDEVLVIAFRDRSLGEPPLDPVRALSDRLHNQMVPLAFPFLRDCARVAGLRLSASIEVRIGSDPEPEIGLTLPLGHIVADNGSRALADL